MLKSKNVYGYSRKKRYIIGRGFVDTMSSVFNSLKPAFRNVASYISANKDLIAKPVLGALGSLAATGLTAGVPAIIKHIANRNKSRPSNTSGSATNTDLTLDDPKYREILQSMMPHPAPVTNIIGSGARGRIGSGIKRF